jgi:ATPase family AAA domain-containing protein 2
MPVKRKRDLFDFDPNKSDSEDENFDPTDDRPARTAKKSRSSGGRSGSSRKQKTRYAGSDIESDDDDLEESEQEASFDESDDDEDVPTNSAGRRMRKAAAKQQNYRESSDDDESVIPGTDDEEDKKPAAKRGRTAKNSKILVIKTNPKNLRRAKEPPTPSVMTRRTRAQTEEAEEFVELSTSGKHAMPARSSRSMSPEAALRATRASKGLKKPPAPPIQEATQESSLHGPATQNEDIGGNDSLDGKPEETEVAEARVESDIAPDQDAIEDSVKGDDNNQDDEMEVDELSKDVVDDDDDDIRPVGRRTRSSRASITEMVAEEAPKEHEAEEPRRLTRGSRLRQKKSLQEPSSDFEPEDGDSDGGNVSASEMSRKNDETGSNGDGESSENSRGRRGKAGAGKRRGHVSDEEDDVDRDEVAMEAEELRASSHSRPRRRRSPSIVYEVGGKRRRTAKPVDYSIKPLDQFMIEPEDDDQEQHATPARRRNARNGGGGVWQRNLLTTFGPFGGGGAMGSLIGGPWGTGATGGVESDSSDDDMAPPRPGATLGGNVGMTPTSAAVPGFAAPLNLEAITGVTATPNVGKIKNQKAFADADPLGVDLTVDFSKVGGLQGHINQLKEMVTLPLLYPELFLRFKVTPPRGVLFHGPPGTGKTLLARALANSVGVGGRKITFYMRKGADALSKWVGEAEKQLRLLFEEARRTQPSIIFFDEIDGLAPVRSSKQEQIHASIVSTLLALMDGMDGRGQVIVIGATNRPDNIDPALRRPGRFDREFYFPLPDLEGRQSILDIHTKDWGLSSEFKKTLAENTKGYGGADLRALCTEAALNAIQRTYPQIYSAKDKLVVDPMRIDIHAADFMISMKRMVPSSERSASSGAAPLPKSVEPLLRRQFAAIIEILEETLPRRKKVTALEEAMFEVSEDDDQGFGRENMNQEFERLRIFRPRLLIGGAPGMGHGYITGAVLHHLEGVHVQNFDLPSLLADGRVSPSSTPATWNSIFRLTMMRSRWSR